MLIISAIGTGTWYIEILLITRREGVGEKGERGRVESEVHDVRYRNIDRVAMRVMTS
jgi:hypothetical protein